MKSAAFALVGLLLGISVVLGEQTAPIRALAAPAPAQAQIAPHHHMIVAAEPDTAKAGLAMLRGGGSAVDAAIAAQMVHAVGFDSVGNGIRRVTGGYEGAADPRREGVALGD